MSPDERADPLPGTFEAALKALDAFRASPLSARQALFAAVMIDRIADAAFAAPRECRDRMVGISTDLRAFRVALRAAGTDLAPVMDLAAGHIDGPRLQVQERSVAEDEFTRLSVAELMVSLYGGGCVPCLMLVYADGRKMPALDVLQAALDWWRPPPAQARMAG
mgnify:CR=1 FL=1